MKAGDYEFGYGYVDNDNCSGNGSLHGGSHPAFARGVGFQYAH
jgi:hypothetical protein